MSDLDSSWYPNSVAANNSSQQIAEIRALHQTIQSQVEETVELHKTIREQIKVTNQQGRVVWVLSIAVAVLTLVQAVGAVIQVWPVFQKPDHEKLRNTTLQESKVQGSSLPNELPHVSSPGKSLPSNPEVERALRDNAASRLSP